MGTMDGSPGTIDKINERFYTVHYTAPSDYFREERVSDSFDKGAWVIGRLYFVKIPYYFEEKSNKPHTAILSNVSFDYALQEGPSLTGLVVVNKPDPNPFKYANADVLGQFDPKRNTFGV